MVCVERHRPTACKALFVCLFWALVLVVLFHVLRSSTRAKNKNDRKDLLGNSCRSCLVFFHEYGRRVGGVPRSSLKGKETQLMMGKRTQGNPRKEPNRTPTNQQTKRPEAVSPSSKQCFLCTEVRQVRKDWLRTIYGPEFSTKVCQEGQCASEEQSEASQRGFVPSKL